ncbi:hypothetical protein [Siccirubricoccus sp. G192]|uniref:hypothetical protein n=1 Tax=Siccirubricoccus sp. G192 TaxID=2849651 RepID=UPI0035C7D899
MVKELAEEGHPAIEGRRQADIRRLVRDQREFGVGRDVVRAQGLAGMGLLPGGNRQGVRMPGRDGRGVGVRLVDDQVADGARVRVHDVSWRRVVVVGNAEERIGIGVGHVGGGHQPRQHLIGGADSAAARQQVVVGAIDVAQANRQDRGIRADDLLQRRFGGHAGGDERGFRLRNLDLFQNEGEVFGIDVETDCHVGLLT